MQGARGEDYGDVWDEFYLWGSCRCGGGVSVDGWVGRCEDVVFVSASGYIIFNLT